MHFIKSKRYHKAARDANLAVLKEANRWEANAPDEGGMTPLHWAAHEGHSEAVRILLERKSSVNKVDGFGNSALHLAAARGHQKCVELVLTKGANLYGLDINQCTACDLARIGEWVEVVEFLEHRMKMLEERNSKLVSKLRAIANKKYAKFKHKYPTGSKTAGLDEDNEFGEHLNTVGNSQYSELEVDDSDDGLDTEQKQQTNLIDLLHHKSKCLTSSTGKSISRSYLVLSQLIKEQSINQTIVNNVETQQHRKPIKNDAEHKDEDFDTEKEASSTGTENSMLTFLKIYHLERFHKQLQDKEIDLNGLMSMTEKDIRTLGLPLGPHRKLCFAVEEYKSAQKWAGA
ncbi:ankyrin repeat and SAM domain-containing protein 4B-like [Toxorhynchites rutilus septentrionalis]|uniref:ankyrin repeat and SAM domain-containing protein 4B-like n=1 Tax=Toxorhynchites rutilus septentrionalis TaxID=329112 RepID=UPI00247A4370|nr:ankyrin repeat and SAM domain-containing protein 4B-like [Toxorhynchites rutilus septentrionalis]